MKFEMNTHTHTLDMKTHGLWVQCLVSGGCSGFMSFLAKSTFSFLQLSPPACESVCVCVCGACLILLNSIFLCSAANSSNYFTTHLPTQSDANEQTAMREMTLFKAWRWNTHPIRLRRGVHPPSPLPPTLGPSPSAAARLAHLTRVLGSCSLQKSP